MSDLWFIANTNTVELSELTNDETGELLGASYTVRMTMSKDGTEVAGQAWPLVLNYDNSDPAEPKFIGRGSHLLELIDYEEYDVKFEAFNAGDGVYGEWNDVVTARIRGVK